MKALKASGESLRTTLSSELEATKAESGAASKKNEALDPLQAEVESLKARCAMLTLDLKAAKAEVAQAEQRALCSLPSWKPRLGN